MCLPKSNFLKIYPQWEYIWKKLIRSGGMRLTSKNQLSWRMFNYEREFGSLFCLSSPLASFCDGSISQELLPRLQGLFIVKFQAPEPEVIQNLLHYRLASRCYSVCQYDMYDHASES